VDDNCSLPTDGTSADPDCTIQEGINRAASGETVRVKPGTYTGTSNAVLANVGAKTISLISTDGPSVTFISRSSSSTGTNPKVRFQAYSGTPSVLEGFTITGGNGTGVEIIDASPTIRNCTITSNTGGDAHGVHIRKSSNPRIENCLIEGNQMTFGRGGGILIDSEGVDTAPAPLIVGCTIQSNSASQGGGGIAVLDGTPVVTNCVISGNTANGGVGGGGIYALGATSAAGGQQNPTCTDGCSGSDAVTLTNCLIANNSAPNSAQDGGGVYLSMNDTGRLAVISNCTFSGNTAGRYGGAIHAFHRCLTLRNSILWDDTAPGGGAEISLDGSTAFVQFSDVKGGLGSTVRKDGTGLVCQPTTSCGVTGNLNANPNFCAAPTDYSLCRVSPCIDAGDNAGVAADLADLDGDFNTTEATPYDLDSDPRFVNDPCTANTGCGTAPIVDMGAYEFQAFQSQIVDWKSVVTHGTSNTIGLVVGTDGLFSEPRNGGVSKLRLSFSSPIDPSSVIASNVVKCGKDVNGQAVDLSGITVTTTVHSGDMGVDINFAPKLPNYARYRVRLNGVQDVDCNAITTNTERIFTSLLGDATGDRRVLSADVLQVNTLVGTAPIDPSFTPQVRADVDNDNDIDGTDLNLVVAEVPKIAAYFITDPVCP